MEHCGDGRIYVVGNLTADTYCSADTTYSKIVDEYNRRRKESEDLRAMAISMYGKKKLEEEMKRKPKGRLHRLYYWVRFKVHVLCL